MASKIDNVVAEAIKKMALVEKESDRQELRRNARKNSLSDWRGKSVAKVAGVGGLTGITGGPWSLALEAGDLAYLMAMAGRACYGVGHILNRDVDYDCDIPNILAIWCGAAEATNAVAAGKIAIKIAGKEGIAIGLKVGAKILSKVALKGSTKVAQKVFAKAGAKLAAKLATKVSVKWIPIIGGVVGAGINAWVTNGLIDAAEQYYTHDYIQFGDEVGSEFN